MALAGRSGRQIAGKLMRAMPSMQACKGLTTQSLPDLPYDYSALEPVISAEIMKLHHGKHHNTYITTLNQSYEKYADAEAKGDIAKMLELQQAIKFNGGGHVNHSIFWQNLTPPKDFEPPSGELKSAIEKDFGSVEDLSKKFNAKAATVQGSGWGWLGYSPELKRLVISTTANQDPLSTQGLVPLLGVDMWEHAYYLQYNNVKADYLKEIWKIVNWKDVASRYSKAQ